MAKIIGKVETTDQDGIAVDLEQLGTYGTSGTEKEKIMLLQGDGDPDGDGKENKVINEKLVDPYLSKWGKF